MNFIKKIGQRFLFILPLLNSNLFAEIDLANAQTIYTLEQLLNQDCHIAKIRNKTLTVTQDCPDLADWIKRDKHGQPAWQTDQISWESVIFKDVQVSGVTVRFFTTQTMLESRQGWTFTHGTKQIPGQRYTITYLGCLPIKIQSDGTAIPQPYYEEDSVSFSGTTLKVKTSDDQEIETVLTVDQYQFSSDVPVNALPSSKEKGTFSDDKEIFPTTPAIVKDSPIEQLTEITTIDEWIGKPKGLPLQTTEELFNRQRKAKQGIFDNQILLTNQTSNIQYDAPRCTIRTTKALLPERLDAVRGGIWFKDVKIESDIEDSEPFFVRVFTTPFLWRTGEEKPTYKSGLKGWLKGLVTASNWQRGNGWILCWAPAKNGTKGQSFELKRIRVNLNEKGIWFEGPESRLWRAGRGTPLTLRWNAEKKQYCFVRSGLRNTGETPYGWLIRAREIPNAPAGLTDIPAPADPSDPAEAPTPRTTKRSDEMADQTARIAKLQAEVERLRNAQVQPPVPAEAQAGRAAAAPKITRIGRGVQ